MSKTRHQQEICGVAEQAAFWVLELQSPNMLECREEFIQWLKESPLHLREFLIASEVAHQLRRSDRNHGLDVKALIQEARSEVPRIGALQDAITRPRARADRWRYAAVVCVCVGAVIAAVSLTRWQEKDRYSTRVGQQLVFRLQDGSVVTLNTNSQAKKIAH